MAEPPKTPNGSSEEREKSVRPPGEWLREGAWDTDPMASFEVQNEPRLDVVQTAHQKNQVAVITHSGYLIIGAMYFFAFLFFLALGSWTYHYIMPESWHWMTEAQLGKIQSIIFSGSLGAITTSIAAKYFKKDPD